MAADDPQLVNRNTNGHGQFLKDVFPAELREITRRRKSGLGGLRKPFMQVIEEAVDAEDRLHEEKQKAEKSKKNESLFVRWIPQAVVELAVPGADKLRDSENEAEQSRRGKSLFVQWIPQSVEKARKKARRIRSDLEKRKEEDLNLLILQKESNDKKDFQAKAKQAQPSTSHDLIGLAFSGGGIRSATFNLGVLQALAEHNILKYIDYLSTVSGGGYIGSCLSSLLNSIHTKSGGQQFPLHQILGTEEPVAVRHLRNSGNYLAPGGFLDAIRIPALLLRGILINFLVVLPYLILAVWLTDWIYGERLNAVANASSFPWAKFYDVTPWVAVLFLIWVIIFPLLNLFWRGKLTWRNAYELSFAAGLLGLALVVLAESLPAALFYYRFWLEKGWGSISGETVTWLTAVGSMIPFVTAGKAADRVSRLSGKIILYALGMLGPLVLLLLYLRLAAWMVLGKPLFGVFVLNGWWIAGITVAIFAYTRRFVDVNSTSLHSFYRDRLSKAYLFQVNHLSEIEPTPTIVKSCVKKSPSVQFNDMQSLSKLNEKGTQAPYHLINVALNLQGSEDPNLRGRNSDFFIFSKLFCGSERTGFCPTDILEWADPHLDLGTAMAISGAAAAPNMGTTTIKPLVFIMTLLNIRLGYWLPNPYVLLTKPWYKRGALWGVGPFYLLLELLSRVNEKSRYVNLSDGGHIENLAIYELLRRRCKFIIVGDGEADSNLTFGGLATLMRYARIDMGIEIKMELDDIRKTNDGLSRKHCALGKVHYGNGETGYLLYIKTSITGDEREYIKEYRARNPRFPHETTADQFFDEAQFEAYHALGYQTVNELFEEPVEGQKIESEVEQKEEVDIAKWFEALEARLRPRFQMEKEFIELQKQLSAIDREFRDPEVAEYTYQIYPEIDPARLRGEKVAAVKENFAGYVSLAGRSGDDREAAKHFHKIFHLCSLQMQLMENVFVSLQLDNPRYRDHYFNRGWMNLFRRWAQAPYFRCAWAVSIGTYSVGFQTFCEEALKLRTEVQWRRGKEGELTHRERYHIKQQRDAKRFGSGEEEKLGQRVKQDQIWIAELAVKLIPGVAGFGSETDDATSKKESFPVGFAAICLSRSAEDTVWGCADLMYYRIQDYYRQMRLLEKMIPVLRETLKRNFDGLSKFRVDLTQNPEVLRRHSHFFERHRFDVVGSGEDASKSS